MSVQATFSNDYYDQDGLFGKSPRLGCFYSERNAHAYVDMTRTIASAPFSFLDSLKNLFNVKRHLTFAQNSQLLVTHSKLKLLEMLIQNPLRPETQALKEEVHGKGIRGSEILMSNLHLLNDCFESANQKNFFTRTLVKVINIFSRLFSSTDLITFNRFEPINLSLFQNNICTPAMELTTEERAASLQCVIENHSPWIPLPAELNSENLRKLQYGLIHNIAFETDGKRFSISYDRQRAEFDFFYINSNQGPTPVTVVERRESGTFASTPVNVVERNLADNSTLNYPLQHFANYSYSREPLSLFMTERMECSFRSSRMEMKANREYTIPLSQGHLKLTILPANHP